jgi:hypothetical protein
MQLNGIKKKRRDINTLSKTMVVDLDLGQNDVFFSVLIWGLFCGKMPLGSAVHA